MKLTEKYRATIYDHREQIRDHGLYRRDRHKSKLTVPFVKDLDAYRHAMGDNGEEGIYLQSDPDRSANNYK